MQTLLLPERSEQYETRERQRVSARALARLSETKGPRRVIFHHDWNATATASQPQPFRVSESREYRHWGINE